MNKFSMNSLSKGIKTSATDAEVKILKSELGNSSCGLDQQNLTTSTSDDDLTDADSKTPDFWEEELDEMEFSFGEASIYDTVHRDTEPKLKSSEKTGTAASIFPEEIWYIILKFLPPEEIGKFAILCRSMYNLVNRHTFWRSLYHKYYDPKIKIPAFLSLQSIERPFAVKSRVVKALQYFYPPFRTRSNKGNRSVSAAIEPLIGKKVTDIFDFRSCYGVKSPVIIIKFVDKSHTSQPDLDVMDVLSDINFNPDFGCQDLRIATSDTSGIYLLNEIIGNTLRSYKAGITNNFKTLSQRVTLVFGTRDCGSRQVAFTMQLVTAIERVQWYNSRFCATKTYKQMML